MKKRSFEERVAEFKQRLSRKQKPKKMQFKTTENQPARQPVKRPNSTSASVSAHLMHEATRLLEDLLLKSGQYPTDGNSGPSWVVIHALSYWLENKAKHERGSTEFKHYGDRITPSLLLPKALKEKATRHAFELGDMNMKTLLRDSIELALPEWISWAKTKKSIALIHEDAIQEEPKISSSNAPSTQVGKDPLPLPTDKFTIVSGSRAIEVSASEFKLVQELLTLVHADSEEDRAIQRLIKSHAARKDLEVSSEVGGNAAGRSEEPGRVRRRIGATKKRAT